jgi:hypothetical protein
MKDKNLFIFIVLGLLLAGGAVAETFNGIGDGTDTTPAPTPDDTQLDSSDIFSGTVTPLTGILTPAQIAQAASGAGFAGDALSTAIAIALAESGGKASAYNPETAAGAPQGQGSFGLWQIYLHKHPEFAGWDLTDPNTNAEAAFAVYNAAGSSFRPWATFGNGAYTKFLAQASAAVNA